MISNLAQSKTMLLVLLVLAFIGLIALADALVRLIFDQGVPLAGQVINAASALGGGGIARNVVSDGIPRVIQARNGHSAVPSWVQGGTGVAQHLAPPAGMASSSETS